MKVDWGFSLAVVVVGLVVVFAVLVILVWLCMLLSASFKAKNGTKESKPEPKQVKTSQPVKTAQPAKTAPVVEEGITDDVVAAISAAIACIMGSEQKFAVRSIKRSKGTRPVWNTAGIMDNTRPF